MRHLTQGLRAYLTLHSIFNWNCLAYFNLLLCYAFYFMYSVFLSNSTLVFKQRV